MGRSFQLHDKYAREIQRIVNQNSKQPPERIHEPLARHRRCQNFVKRPQFEEVLKKCSAYARHKITCFISYAWNNPEHEKWVWQFAEDLEKAGVRVILDKWLTRKGHETWSFVERMLMPIPIILCRRK